MRFFIEERAAISRMHATRVFLLVLFAWLAAPDSASAYLVQYSPPLPELEELSEVIFKGTVTESKAITDKSFKDVSGFASYETTFEIVSVVKGRIKNKKRIRFRHYGEKKDESVIRMYMPQWYNLEPGKSYIVCGKLAEDDSHIRQIWDAHRSKEDQGVLRCADAQPHRGESLAEVYWNELQQLLNSDDPADNEYAIKQLRRMTGLGHSGHKSFDHARAVKVVSRLLENEDDSVVKAAIQFVAAENPTFGGTIWSLTRLNPAHFPGHSSVEIREPNAAAKKNAETLIRIADSDSDESVRSLAVLALCSSDNSELFVHAKRWSVDESEKLRAAAAILLADFADRTSKETWLRLLEDSSAEVRERALRAIAIGRVKELLPELDRRLDDEESKVVAGAAAAILAFPIDDSRELLKKRIEHPEFECLFVNALATESTAPYVVRLGKTIRANPTPKNWWGGHVPWGIAWSLLFKHAQKQSPAELRDGKFDAVLDSLESPVAEQEKSIHYSSSEPRDLYALYVQRGMHARAKAYRKLVKEKTRYDMDRYFDQVDQHPNNFQRN